MRSTASPLGEWCSDSFSGVVADPTQAEIGEQRIGLSQMQVSRVIRRALRGLEATPDAKDSQTVAA